MSDLLERLEKRAKEDDDCADNSRAVADLLSPELAKFNERDESGWNTYAVRMAVDHRSSMERDRRYASDLREAIAEIESLRARLAVLEPFAKFAEIGDPETMRRLGLDPDKYNITDTTSVVTGGRHGHASYRAITWGDIRRAREAWGGEDG